MIAVIWELWITRQIEECVDDKEKEQTEVTKTNNNMSNLASTLFLPFRPMLQIQTDQTHDAMEMSLRYVIYVLLQYFATMTFSAFAVVHKIIFFNVASE